MEIDRKELKYRAREAMGQTRPRFWAVTLVYLLMTTGVSLLLDALPLPAGFSGIAAASIFLLILFTLYSLVVDFGYNLWSLWTIRRLDPGMGSLIQGFSVAGRVILMELSISLRMLGWAICISAIFVIPLVLAATTLPALIVPCIAAIYAASWAVMLRYALAPYLLADHPDDGVNAAVRRSVDLMRGWKWELFKLELSFLGWVLLSMALSAAATALALWHAGFFQAVTAFDPDRLSELIQNYILWDTGFSLGTFSADQLQLFQLYSGVTNGALTAVLSSLIALPVTLWLTPYRSVARAGFYDARLQLQREGPEMPPL